MNGPAMVLLASLVMEDGRRWIESAIDWQLDDARALLEPGPGDPLLHFDTRPRGGSKTTDAAGIAAAAMVELLPAGTRAYALASDKDQARLVVDALQGFVVRTPGLASAISVDRYSATTPTGTRLEVISADEASSYGLRGHLYIVDELTQWPSANQGVWVSVVSALPKVPGARLLVLSSAGDPAHWSYRVRERARESKAWRLHEVPGPVPWVSPEALEEQRALLMDSQFARLHLNQWTASEDRLVSVEGLAAAVRLPGPQAARTGVVYRMGVDLGLRHDRTAVAICHAEPATDGARTKRVVLDRMLVWSGTRESEVSLANVEAAIVEAWSAYNRPKVRLDPWQAIGLAQRLRRRGVSVEEWSYTPQRYGAIASTLYALLRDGLLDLYDDPELIEELANVRLKETLPGLVRIEHDPGRHEDRAVALGFAAVPLVERPSGGLRLHVPTGDLPRPHLVRPLGPASDPGPRVVSADDEQRRRGSVRLGKRFRIPPDLRRHYTPPGKR